MRIHDLIYTVHQNQSVENTHPHTHMHTRVLTSLLFFANSDLCWAGLSKGRHYQALERSSSSLSSSDDRLYQSTSAQCWHTPIHVQIYNTVHLFKTRALLDWSWNAEQILYNNCYDLLRLTAGTLPFMSAYKSGNWEDERWLYTCWEDIPKQLEVSCLGNSKHVTGSPTYSTSGYLVM